MFNKYKTFFSDIDNQKKYAKWIIKHTKAYIKSLLLLTLLSSFSVVLSIVTALIGKRIIDNAIYGKEVLNALIVYAIVTVLEILLGSIYSLISVVITEKYAFQIRQKVYRGVLDTCWSSISKYHSGDVMTRLTSDINIVASGVSGLISNIIVLLTQLILAFCTLFYFDKWLAVLTLTIAPITAIISIWLGKKLRFLQVKVQETEAKYRSFMQESVANQLIIKAFNNQDYSEKTLENLRNNRLHWILRKNKMNVIASGTMSFAYTLVYVIAFGWGAIRLSLKEITYGTMSVFLSLVGQIQDPLVELSKQLPQIITILASAGRIVELEELEKDVYIEDGLNCPSKVDVKVENIEFSYDNGMEKVFDNACLDIKSGEFVAILGESGVGKTTLIRLIMGFMNTNNGQIKFEDENNSSEIVNGHVREYMSYVPQGNTLFSGTIRENIRMGKTDATDEEIDEAVKAAYVDTFIDNLPNGLDTVLGEKGHGVSEGQAQRIAIARALIKKAPLLILDEATSSLDEMTELKVLESIGQLSPRPTCILITHRRSVLKICDREIKINNGKIESLIV